MTLLQVVTYAKARVGPVLRVLCPQILMSVGVWSQEQSVNWGFICTCSRGLRIDAKPGRVRPAAIGHPVMAMLTASHALTPSG